MTFKTYLLGWERPINIPFIDRATYASIRKKNFEIPPHLIKQMWCGAAYKTFIVFFFTTFWLASRHFVDISQRVQHGRRETSKQISWNCNLFVWEWRRFYYAIYWFCGKNLHAEITGFYYLSPMAINLIFSMPMHRHLWIHYRLKYWFVNQITILNIETRFQNNL